MIPVLKAGAFLSLFLAALLASCNGSSGNSSQKEEPHSAEPPTISIEVKGAPSGLAFLIATFENQNYRLDSTEIDPAGKMTFQSAEPYPPGLLYLLLPDQSFFQLLVDKDQTFTMSTRAGDLINAMKVEGSTNNDLLYQALQFELEQQAKFQEVAQQLQRTPPGTPAYQEIRDRQNQLVADRTRFLERIFDKHPNSFFTKFKKAGQNPEIMDVYRPDGSLDTERQVFLYRSQFWNDVDFSDERLLRTPVIFNKLQRYITELTPQQPDSIKQSAAFLIDQVLDYPEYYKFFVNWIGLNYEPNKTSLMDSEAVFVFMVQNYFTNERAFWADSTLVYALQLRAHEMAASLVGQKGPDVQANDPSGMRRSISEIKAPYVIVFLYNPTCDHCIEETPRLVSFYREWKSKGVEVFAIALDTDDQEWKNFITRNGMNWINVFDPTNQAFYAKYYVDVTPEIYVLNRDRIIIAKNLKVHQIEEVIRRDQEKGS